MVTATEVVYKYVGGEFVVKHKKRRIQGEFYRGFNWLIKTKNEIRKFTFRGLR